MVAAAALSIAGYLMFAPYAIAREFCLGWLARACRLSGGVELVVGSAAAVGWFRLVVVGPCCLVGGCSGISRWMGRISAELKFTVLRTTTDFIPVSILFLYFYLWC